MEATSRIPSALKRNPANNPHAYSRDLLLSLYRPNLEVPEEADLSLTCFYGEVRPPLANIPLSDLEKKLLTMVSINSEVGNRRFNNQNKQQRKPQQDKGM